MNAKYDVVIIGAGIGGLVCGCYLAKAGLKVLIVEQQDKPGGYCTSFERGGYRFDVGVHYLGSYKKGILRKILDDLELDLAISEVDPIDKIIMPDSTVYIRTNLEDTIEEFKRSFPDESQNIEIFFRFIFRDDFMSIYSKTKKISFKELLDSSFKNNKIKATLNVLLGNLGLCASNCSAPVGIVLFRTFVFNSGCYPNGGIQRFPDALVKKFLHYGGELILSHRVTKVLTKDNKVRSVILSDEKEIETNIVVSNGDATQVFKELLDTRETKEYNIVDKLMPSPSAFKVYLGLKKNISSILKEPCNVWYFSTDDVDGIFSPIEEQELSIPKYFICNFPSMHDKECLTSDKGTMEIFVFAPYLSENMWKKNKESLSNQLIKEVEKKIMPSLTDFIELAIPATPLTFERYTSNRKGALFGWASTLSQTNNPLFYSETSVEDLYLVGHWCLGRLGQGGIPGVATSGLQLSRLIVEKIKGENKGIYKFYEFI